MATDASAALALRAAMPALANKTYFNYGGQGPLPTPSLDAITTAWQRIQELGPFTTDTWPFVEQTVTGLRQHLAREMGVAAQRIAFTENVTAGCVLPLWGLPWEPGDSLLLSDAEHPGVVAACRELARRQGLTVASLPVQQLRGGAEATAHGLLEALEQALTPRTRLVVLSHLLWNTGQLLPIAAVAERLAAHPRHPWLLVDGAQSLGSVPVASAAAAADIYACTGHKWCCGPEGLGLVVVSPRLLEQGEPTLIGWRSLRDPHNPQGPFHRDARRFEVATACTPLFAGLHRSLQALAAVGTAEQRLSLIQRHSRRLWQGLMELPGVEPLLQVPPPAGLVSFTAADTSPEALINALGQRGVWLRTLEDPACGRACTHVTTTEAEVDALLRLLSALTSG